MGAHTAITGSGDLSPTMTPGRRRSSALPVLLIVMGVLVLLTPVVLTRMQNAEQAEIARGYAEAMRELSPGQRDQELAEARVWNEQQVFAGTPDPWSVEPDELSPDYQAYLGQLDINPVMSRVIVPSAQIDLPVYHGTSEHVLSHGAGHLFGTALPVGGAGTHAVITGHTGISTSTLFDNLAAIELGDTITLQTVGDTLTYRVDDISVVLPEETDRIRPETGRDLVTLITCTPYGVNSHRLLVRGERVDTPGHNSQQTHGNPWQWWMKVALVVSGLALLGLIIWLLRRRKKS